MGKNVRTTPGLNILSRPGPCLGRAPHFGDSSESAPPVVALATFTHSVHTGSNAIKFSHQSLYSPKVSSLLKAVRRGFLKGCPTMSVKLILKYLNPSAALAKGHMKRPRHGIRSTRARTPVKKNDAHLQVEPVPVILPFDNAPPEYQPLPPGPNLIANDEDQSIANIFCFGAFTDKQSGIVYHDNTGLFPVMLFDISVFFLYYTITSQAQSSPCPSRVWMTSVFSRHTSDTLKS